MPKVIEHIYEPWGGCREVFHARDEEVLVSGPAGTGKSRACLEKLNLMCLKNPGMRGLIVRKTLTSLGSTALVTWRNFVIKEALESGDVVFYGGSQQEAAQYRYTNGSSVTIGGLDKPTRIMSSEYDIIYVQEATELTLADLDMLTTRLRNWRTSFQQLLMDCNPDSEKHWLKLRCNEKKTRLIESRHEDNPRLFTKDGKLTERGKKYIGLLDKLTGVRLARLRHGKWVSAEGIIYEEFDSNVHILQWTYDNNDNRLMLPNEWDRYWVIDWGYVHPFVCQWWAEGPDGEGYMYREIYMTQRTVAQHAKTILDQVTKIQRTDMYNHLNGIHHIDEQRIWIEPKPRKIICDHDAEDRRTLENEMEMGTVAAIKDVSVGLDLCKELLRPDERGLAQLQFMEDTLVERDQYLVDNLLPVCTVEEIPSYAYVIGADGRRKEEPKKEHDHGMDTMRYYAMDRKFKGKARATQI